MDVTLRENEHIEYISDRLRLIVSPEHTFGTDALLLAAFAFPKTNDAVCDLGSGCGIIPFYWLARGLARVTAVELQAQAANQLERSASLSGAEDRVTVLQADLRGLKGLLPADSFDKVTMNPPYTQTGHGVPSAKAADLLARHENAASLPEICASAARLLKFGGAFSLCLRPERLAQAVRAMQDAGLEPKRLRFVCKNAATAPWLFLMEGKKGRAPGMTVEPALCLYTPEGAETAEYRAIAAPYRKD